MRKHGLIGFVVVMSLVLSATVFFPHTAHARIEGAYWRIEDRCFEGEPCKITHVLYTEEQNEKVYLSHDTDNKDLNKDGIRFVNADTYHKNSYPIR